MRIARGGAPGWDPGQYLKFGGPRARPAADLLARVPVSAPRHIVDLGCGAGNITAILASRWPEAAIVGVDADPAMLDCARTAAPGTELAHSGIADWTPGTPPDLIWSNAALHWLDDHEALFPRLMAALAPGGALAVQMPRNFGAPSHRAIVEAADAGPWRDRLAPAVARYRAPGPVAEPGDYLAMLAPAAREVDIWETTYLHVLRGDDPVLDWIAGSALRPVLAPLTEEAERAAFLADLGMRLRAAYPPGADGRTPFPFRRLFIVAIRA